MDPLTHGLLGATTALCLLHRCKAGPIALAGAIGGMLPDADMFIRSATDPLLEVEFHRHFTHSLAFIPVGGLIAACLLWFFLKNHLSFKKLVLYSTVGYATHSLLDTCTSYGTMLLWPFSNARIAWDNIAIIDPVYTFILIAALIATLKIGSSFWARVGSFLSIAYLLIGIWQRDRAYIFQSQVAKDRGHSVVRSAVHPTIGNLLLWRSTYEAGETYYVDALRIGLTNPPLVYTGESVPILHSNEDFKNIPMESAAYKDILRFGHFSDEWLYLTPEDPRLISDLRYSILPHKTTPLWAIEFDETKSQEHVPFKMLQSVEKRDWRTYLEMLKGNEIK